VTCTGFAARVVEADCMGSDTVRQQCNADARDA
jgi:hypothetical protein